MYLTKSVPYNNNANKFKSSLGSSFSSCQHEAMHFGEFHDKELKKKTNKQTNPQ